MVLICEVKSQTKSHAECNHCPAHSFCKWTREYFWCTPAGRDYQYGCTPLSPSRPPTSNLISRQLEPSFCCYKAMTKDESGGWGSSWNLGIDKVVNYSAQPSPPPHSTQGSHTVGALLVIPPPPSCRGFSCRSREIFKFRQFGPVRFADQF
jgi:hypothetical protein